MMEQIQTKAFLIALSYDSNTEFWISQGPTGKRCLIDIKENRLRELRLTPNQSSECTLPFEELFREINTPCIFEYLESTKGDILWYPGGNPNCLPRKDDLIDSCSHLVYFESDEGTLEEQLEAIDGLPLAPTAIVYSGGKSLHCYFKLSKAIPMGEITGLKRAIQESIPGGDRAVASDIARLMRLPGFTRANGKLQELYRLSPDTEGYTPEEFKAAFPEWEEYVDTSKKTKTKRRTSEHPTLKLTNFSWEGHKWIDQGGRPKGYCAFHESHTGTAAWIDDRGKYHCPTCTDNKGISVQEYQRRLKEKLGVFSGETWNPESNRYEVQCPFCGSHGAIASEVFECKNCGVKTDRLELDEDWVDFDGFTPDHIFDSRFVTADSPNPGECVAIKAGLGSGKTHWANEQLEGKKWFALCHRKSIRDTLAERFDGVAWNKSDKSVKLNDPETYPGLTMCFESLHHLKHPESFIKDRILILDEYMSAIDHVLHSKTMSPLERGSVLKSFEALLEHAESVIVLDGNLQDYALKPISRAGKKIIKHAGTYQSEQSPLYLYDSQNLKLMFEYTKGNSIVASDSRSLLEKMAYVLKKQGIKHLLLTSRTREQKESVEFIKNPNKYLEENPGTRILFSPSVDSALDISIKGYFKTFFGFFYGVVPPMSINQMMGRVRDGKCIKKVYVKNESVLNGNVIDPKKRFESLLETELKFIESKRPDLSLTEIYKKAIDNLDDSPWAEVCNYQYKTELAWRQSPETAYLELLDRKGINYTAPLTEKVKIPLDIDEYATAMQQEESKAIFKAKYWENRPKELPTGHTREQYLDFTHSNLYDILKTDDPRVWNQEFVRKYHFDYQFRELIQATRVGLFVMNEVCFSKNEERILKRSDRVDEYRSYDYYRFDPKILALKELNVTSLVGRAYSKDDPEVLRILKTVFESDRLKAVLGLTRMSDPFKYPIRSLGAILKTFGFENCKEKRGVYRMKKTISDLIWEALKNTYDAPFDDSGITDVSEWLIHTTESNDRKSLAKAIESKYITRAKLKDLGPSIPVAAKNSIKALIIDVIRNSKSVLQLS